MVASEAAWHVSLHTSLLEERLMRHLDGAFLVSLVVFRQTSEVTWDEYVLHVETSVAIFEKCCDVLANGFEAVPLIELLV